MHALHQVACACNETRDQRAEGRRAEDEPDVSRRVPRYAELPDRLKRGRDALAVMDTHLKSRAFFVGERYSIADIALYAYTHVAPEGGHDLAPYPNVLAWIDRVAGQPKHIPITYRPPA